MIRKANSNDIEKVASTYKELLEYEKENGTNSNWELNVYPTKNTAETAFKNGTLFVLEENDEICASLILNHNQAEEYKNINWTLIADDEEVLVIHTLCVPPSKGGHGYGRKMVQFAIDYARQHKCKTIRIDTWSKNNPAQNLYQKCGFKILGQQHVMHMGLIDEVLVYLELRL